MQKKKTIILFFKINQKEKGIIVFTKKFAIKNKDKIKLIYDNKIFDLRSMLPIGNHKFRIKIKLLLLSDILYIGEILKNFETSLEYIINDNIFPPSIFYKFPKLVYNAKGEDDNIKMFDENFVGLNFQMMILYENIIFPIDSYFPKYNMDEEEEKFEIFLLALEKPEFLNQMFYECSELEEISINEKDDSIISEDKKNDLTNSISEYITINNAEDSEKKSNAFKWINEIEKYGHSKYYENLYSSIIIKSNPTKNNTAKSLLSKYFNELNTNLLETKTSYFKDIPSLIEISNICKWKPTFAYSMFHDCSSLKSIPDISNWNTDNLVNIYSMFYNCKKLISIPDISKWNLGVNHYLDMHHLFFNCSSLKSIPDISNWDTAKTTNLSGVFSGCSSLNSLPDISKWKTNLNQDLSSMFENCSSLIALPDLSKWDTHWVKDMHNMFYGCSSLMSLPDISKWDTQKLEDITALFCGCSSLHSLPDISKWETFKLKKMSLLFRECTSLKSIPDISKWFIIKVEDFTLLFNNCITLFSLPDLS